MYKILFILVLLSNSMTAYAEDGPNSVQELKQGMPKPVANLIDRIVDCNHWAGEEPYDEGRKKEINQAIDSLRCSVLVNDELVLISKYGKNDKVRANITSAKRLFM